MKDIQNQRDYRNIPINEVGIKNLRYPITVRDRRDGFQPATGSLLGKVFGYSGEHEKASKRRLGPHGDDVSLFYREKGPGEYFPRDDGLYLQHCWIK
jgi:hypothetical protein